MTNTFCFLSYTDLRFVHVCVHVHMHSWKQKEEQGEMQMGGEGEPENKWNTWGTKIERETIC